MNKYFGLRTRHAMMDTSKYSLEKALQYIQHDFVYRNSGEELLNILNSKYMNCEQLNSVFNPQLVKGWLNGKKISRDKAFEICIATKMTIEESEVFIKKICEANWVHLRDYKDIIYFFLIKNGQRILDSGESNNLVLTAQKLISEYSNLSVFNPDADEEYFKNFRVSKSVTEMSKEQMYECLTLGDLRDFLSLNSDFLGAFNQTAYRHFKEAVDYWQDEVCSPELEDLHDDIGLNTLTALADEIRGRIYKSKSNQGLTDLQIEIKVGAPDRQSITDAYNKRKNVTRKQLILINMLLSSYNDEYGITFEEAVKSINKILYECGMPLLDSLNPFDWAVLNSLSTLEDENDSIPMERWEQITEIIFPLDN